MGDVVIDVTISKGDASLMDDFDQILADSGMVRVAMHGPGACDACRDNRDPENVPVVDCRGNIAAEHGATGYSCQCWVDIVRTDANGRAVMDDA